jgi:hypothetical protein
VCQQLDFQGAITTVTGGDVFLQSGVATCSTVDASVMVNDLTGIWTVGFDLGFPASLLEYEGYTLGPLLLQGNPVNAPVVLVNQTSTGLQVMVSRLQPDPGVDAIGAKQLISFQFRKLAGGTGMIDFDSSPASPVSETILDASGGPRPASFGPGHGGLVTVP